MGKASLFIGWLMVIGGEWCAELGKIIHNFS
jgi:hypothetical protein